MNFSELEKHPEYKKGQQFRLYKTKFWQDFNIWSYDFKGKKFILNDIINGSAELISKGFGCPKKYGAGSIFVSLKDLERASP